MSKTPIAGFEPRRREDLPEALQKLLPEDFTDYVGHPLDLGDYVLIWYWNRVERFPLDVCSSGFMIRQPGGGIPINSTYVRRKKLIRADKAHDLGLRFP